jgi:ribonuclease HI
VKAHNGNCRKELADQLAQDAANSNEVEITYNKIPKSGVTRASQEED